MLSIITPVLNGAKFILNNIESIQKLSIPYEHIIIDGGSTDGTIELVKLYPHIKLLNQTEKNGMYGAIHQGFLEAQGDYITWINADDYIIPDGYALMYNHILNHKADLVYSNSIFHYVEKLRYKKIFASYFGRYLLKQGIMSFVQPSSIFSKIAYEKVGGLNFLDFRIIGDRDLFQRMAYQPDIKFLYLRVFSTVFLIHSNSLLYKNRLLLKKEHSFCIRTNNNIINRFIYHSSRFLNKLSIKNYLRSVTIGDNSIIGV